MLRRSSLARDAPSAADARGGDQSGHEGGHAPHDDKRARECDRGPHERDRDDLGSKRHSHTGFEIAKEWVKEAIADQAFGHPRAGSSEAPDGHDEEDRCGQARDYDADRGQAHTADA